MREKNITKENQMLPGEECFPDIVWLQLLERTVTVNQCEVRLSDHDYPLMKRAVIPP